MTHNSLVTKVMESNMEVSYDTERVSVASVHPQEKFKRRRNTVLIGLTVNRYSFLRRGGGEEWTGKSIQMDWTSTGIVCLLSCHSSLSLSSYCWK